MPQKVRLNSHGRLTGRSVGMTVATTLIWLTCRTDPTFPLPTTVSQSKDSRIQTRDQQPHQAERLTNPHTNVTDFFLKVIWYYIKIKVHQEYPVTCKNGNSSFSTYEKKSANSKLSENKSMWRIINLFWKWTN